MTTTTTTIEADNKEIQVKKPKGMLVGGENQPDKVDIETLIKKLSSMWNGFNPDTYRRILNTEKTILSVAMLSLIRTNKLLAMMAHWNDYRYISSNLALRVQAAEHLNQEQREEINFWANKVFDLTKVKFTHGNEGSGAPRHEMVQEALNFNTPYIMTTDDDMFFPMGSIELLISVLEDNPELGAIDLYCFPNLNAWEIGEREMRYRPPKQGLDYCDAMGSATMIIRREVFDTCNLDPDYFVGWGDIDFCVQMRKEGWKLAILTIPDYMAFNDTKGSPESYKEIRNNIEYARKSAKRFKEKWGIEI